MPDEITATTGRTVLTGEATGRFDLHWSDRWDQGATDYTITGPRLAGTVTVTFALPTSIGDELTAFPGNVQLQCWPGRESHPDSDDWVARDRTDHLTVNGIAITGVVQLSVHRFADEGLTRLTAHLRRLNETSVTHELPDRTHDRARAVLQSVLDHWCDRSPHAELMLLHRVRSKVGEYLERIGHRRATVEQQLRAGRAELDALDGSAVTAQAIGKLPSSAAALNEFARLIGIAVGQQESADLAARLQPRLRPNDVSQSGTRKHRGR